MYIEGLTKLMINQCELRVAHSPVHLHIYKAEKIIRMPKIKMHSNFLLFGE